MSRVPSPKWGGYRETDSYAVAALQWTERSLAAVGAGVLGFFLGSYYAGRWAGVQANLRHLERYIDHKRTHEMEFDASDYEVDDDD